VDIEEPAALLTYLRRTGRVAETECPEIRILRGGVSNRTVLVTRPGGERWVLKQALPQLRVAVEWFSPPERIYRETLGMQWLGQILPKGAVPQFVFDDPEQFVLCMSAVPEPNRNWKEMLLAGELVQHHVDQFARLLAAIHSERSPEAAGAFGDTSFFESLRLEPYYAYTASRVPAASAFLNVLLCDTRSTKLSMVHGDYSPKNILVHGNQLVLLDHEVIHFGDPAFDVGFSLTHLLSKAHHVGAHRDAFREAAVRYWREYSAALPSAALFESRAVRHSLGCLLARVDGRSPLEYLSDDERNRQRTAVLSLMIETPADVSALIDEFVRRVS
jgi:5-methylthioribose kinase